VRNEQFENSMIGVIADADEKPAVREFFELFKTPWEFFREDERYEVVLCAGDAKLDHVRAKLLLIYAGKKTGFDVEQKVQIQSQRTGAQLSFFESPLPICGSSLTFRHQSFGGLTERDSGESAAYAAQRCQTMFVRVGYDIFREVQSLLTHGQAIENAEVPTLELHIAFLRDLITGCGIPLLEIPPVPDGYSFLGCLTHDVDFGAIRGHKFDATMFGFLYRATLGSALDAGRGRISLNKLFTNWGAVAKLPFVFAGFARDFWYEFDRYLEIEKGRPSTFFLIPFARHPGRLAQGAAPRARGCRYDISQITPTISKLLAAGCEIGLHGIDAWLYASSGRAEALRITQIGGTTELGVRMHWLYSDERSPSVLEEAEFSYDSTVGYNETVGYRAGTTQVFKPLHASRLLELPMHVMDTAMFYPSHMNLSSDEGWRVLAPILDNSVRYGGVLTINWHDRSIAPERLWGDFYERLLDEMTIRGAWFCNAGQAVSWFRKRRSAVFEKVSDHEVRLAERADQHNEKLPGLRLQLHPPRVYHTNKSLSNGIKAQVST
jgi:hypothetical protein